MKTTRILLPLTLAAAILSAAVTADSQVKRAAQPGATATAIQPDATSPLDTRIANDGLALTEDGRLHLFLQMEDTPAALLFAERNDAYYQNARLVLRGGADEARREAEQRAATESLAHARLLDQKQQGLVNRLTSPEFNATIVYRTQTATNGIAVLARPEQWEALSQLPGVVNVAIIRPKTLRVNSSINYMGTRNFWDPASLNARGEGIGVAIIDTGLDFVHRSFGGSGDGTPTGTGTTSYVRNATTIGGTTPQTNFPTAKVIWGWDLVGDAYNGGFATPPVTTPSPDPNPMDVNGHGTACASLAAGFGTTSSNTTYTGPWDATNPDTAAATTKVSPGIAPLAALYGFRVFGIGGSTFVSADAVDIATAVRLWQLAPEGTPLPPRLTALNGAAAVPRTPVLAVLSMSLGDDAGLDYPGDPDTDSAQAATAAGLSVIAAAGNAYDNYYNAGTPANATSAISVAASLNGQGTTIADSMASYSSRGPRPSDSKLKPDITGPAESVSTASVGTNNGNRSFNGTSSATPHVAGAMALIRQYRPGYTAEEYKALLMNSVRVDPRVNPTGAFYGISRIGVGRVTLNPADGFPTALAMSAEPDAPVNVSFGLVSVPVNSSQQQTQLVRVVNKDNFARTFSVGFTPWATTPGASFSLPDGNSVNVPANGQATLRVQLNVTGSELRHSRDAQAAASQGANARNFISEAAGRLQFTEVGGAGHGMRLSVYSVVRPTSSLSVTPAAIGPNATQTFTFAGTGINTGANTSTLTNNPADIISHAKAFELQYQNLASSGTIFEQSEIKYAGVTSDFPLRANPFDPTVGATNQSAVLVFAVAMHKDYAIPGELGTQVRILIDRNRTGATDIVLRNYTANTSTAQNVYLTGTSANAGNVSAGTTVTSTGFFANITTGQPNNMLNNNIAMLPVRAQQLGLTAATARFNYKVQVTRHDAFGYTINSESPWLTYDVANPGLDPSSGNGNNEPFVLNGQPGLTFLAGYSASNLQANGSLGMLLVYPHNATGARTQVVPLAGPLAMTAAVSRKTHAGAGTFDVALPGVESRSTGGNHTVVVAFNNEVASGSANVSSGVGSVSGTPTFSANTMTVNLTGVANGQNLTLNLDGVTDSFGQALQPTAITLSTLAGDVNGNRSVTTSDVGLVKSQAGAPIDGSNFRTDVNANGAINATDVSAVKANSGNTVP
jgi:subtilisin family serine protease